MNRIRVNKGSFHIGQFNLENGSVTIGRHSSNDISLNDTTVSGEHAKITTVMNTSYIQDLGSTNGTFVNDQKVGQRLLRANDIITIGAHDIMFFSDQVAQNPAQNSDNDKTQLVSPLKTRERKSNNPYLNSDNPFLNKK